jgi:hypothetical protein
MTKSAWTAIAVATVFASSAAGCGETPQVTVFEQGKYQGKPDNQPWDNDRYKSDKTTWENAIKARTNRQNEYTRLTAQ